MTLDCLIGSKTQDISKMGKSCCAIDFSDKFRKKLQSSERPSGRRWGSKGLHLASSATIKPEPMFEQKSALSLGPQTTCSSYCWAFPWAFVLARASFRIMVSVQACLRVFTLTQVYSLTCFWAPVSISAAFSASVSCSADFSPKSPAQPPIELPSSVRWSPELHFPVPRPSVSFSLQFSHLVHNNNPIH